MFQGPVSVTDAKQWLLTCTAAATGVGVEDLCNYFEV